MIAVVSVAVTVFVVAYVRPGRSGSAILAFGAGYLLATIWAEKITSYLGTPTVQTPLQPEIMVYAGVVLIPGIAVLLFGPKQQGLIPRAIGALIASVFALALMHPALMNASGNEPVHDMLMRNKESIITVGVIAGVLDLVASRSNTSHKKNKV
jgi:hypothetical protein